MMKLLFGLIFLVVVAIGSYKMGARSQNSSEIQQLKNNLITLTREDFLEYQNLKTLEERYNKADEILGKIVGVFLADIGLRLAYTPKPMNEKPCPNSISGSAKREEMRSKMKKKYKLHLDWTYGEYSLGRATSKLVALEQVQKIVIPDLAETLKDASPLPITEAWDIEGHFQGEIVFSDPKVDKSNWRVDWDVKLQSDRKSGSTSILVTRVSDDKVINQIHGDGSLQDFLRPEGSDALIVTIAKGKGYMQIYPIGGKENWVGNYYHLANDNKFHQAGQVSLHETK